MIWKDIDKRHELYMDTINTSDRIDEHPPCVKVLSQMKKINGITPANF